MDITPEVTFTACSETVIRFISGAKKFIKAAVCWFTHPEIFQCLVERAREGVRVQIIVNFDQFNFHPGGLNFNELNKMGSQIYGFPGPGLLHHKFAVADNQSLLTGSFNWTRSEHFDHVLVWENTPLATEFSAAFENLIPQCSPLNTLMDKPVRFVSFRHIHHPKIWTIQDLRKAILAGGKVWIAPFSKKEQAVWQQSYSGQRHYCRGNPALQQFWKQYKLWESKTFSQWLSKQEAQAEWKAIARYCLVVKPGDVMIAVEPKGKLLAVGLIGSDPEESDLMTYPVSRYVPWVKWPEDAAVPDPSILNPGKMLRRYAGSGLRVVEALNAATKSVLPSPAF